METKTKSQNLIVIVGVILVLLLTGVGYFVLTLKKPENKPLPSTEKQANEAEGQQKDVITSIKDAMMKSLSLRCDYVVGKNKTTAYVKGNMVRIDGIWQGTNNGGAILKDNKMWTWNTETKEGVIIPMQDMKTGEVNRTQEDIVRGLEDQKQFCKVAVVADSLFEPPSDITFQDMGELMKNLPKGD